MKLVLCKKCQDVFKLDLKIRRCKCKECWGKYLPDGLNAVYGGESAIPLGMGNSSLLGAIADQRDTGWGEKFDAFVIPKVCPTMVKMASPPFRCKKG